MFVRWTNSAVAFFTVRVYNKKNYDCVLDAVEEYSAFILIKVLQSRLPQPLVNSQPVE